MSRFFILLFSIIQICFSDSSVYQTNSLTPSAEQFYVSDGTPNSSCIVLEFMATIDVSYKNGTGKIQKVTGYINSTQFEKSSTRAYGSCGIQNQTMSILWPAAKKNGSYWNLSFLVNNITNKNYEISQLKLLIPLNGTFIDDNHGDLALASNYSVSVPMNTYYYCKNEVSMTFSDKSGESTAKISSVNLKFISYRQSNKDMFYGAQNKCLADNLANNIVPLVVGGVLAAMVVIVIITYLIGRRRHRGNYQTI